MALVMLGNVSPIAAVTDPETGIKTRSKFVNVIQSTCGMNIVEVDLFDAMRDVINAWRDQSDQAPG